MTMNIDRQSTVWSTKRRPTIEECFIFIIVLSSYQVIIPLFLFVLLSIKFFASNFSHRFNGVIHISLIWTFLYGASRTDGSWNRGNFNAGMVLNAFDGWWNWSNRTAIGVIFIGHLQLLSTSCRSQLNQDVFGLAPPGPPQHRAQPASPGLQPKYYPFTIS